MGVNKFNVILIIASTNNKMKYLICILWVLQLKTCRFPDEGYMLLVENNTNHIIALFVEETSYPDTSIIEIKPIVFQGRYCLTIDAKPELFFVQPNSINTHDLCYRGRLEDRYRFNKIEKLSVFIFHNDTIDKYTWEEVREDYMVLKRYDLSLKDFQNLDFTVTYPPDEAMKNIEQYPPLGSE